MAIAAAIFDMDGVLIDSVKLITRAWRQAAREKGFDLTDEIRGRMIGRRGHDSLQLLSEAFGGDFDGQWTIDRAMGLYEESVANGELKAKPGVHQLLDFLDSRNIDKAVATSTPRDSAIEKLSLVGLADRFSTIVGGDEIKFGKPAPDIFLRAAHELKASAAQCVVFEDAEAGIVAAHSAGMTPIMVPDFKQPSEKIRSMAAIVLESLRQAPEFLRGMVELR